MKTSLKKFLPAVAVLLVSTGFASAAHAQMFNSPWGFTAQNRASIAALMRRLKIRTATQPCSWPSPTATQH